MENIAIHAATAGEGEGRGRAGDKFRGTTLFLRSSSACYSTLPSCTRIVLIGSYREFNSPLLPRCSSTGRIESGRDHRARSFSPRLSLFASLLFNFLPRVSCTTFERRLLIGLLLSVQIEGDVSGKNLNGKRKGKAIWSHFLGWITLIFRRDSKEEWNSG